MAEQDGNSTPSTGVVAPPWWARAITQDSLLAAALVILCALVNAPPGLVDDTGTTGGPSDVHQASVALWWLASGFITVAVALRRRFPLPAVAVRYRRTVSLVVMGVLLLSTIGWNVVAAATGRPIPGLPSLPYASGP